MFATGTADRKFCIFEENRHCARNAAHPTSENGKLAAFASGRPAFRQHAKHAEGSDTSHVSHTQKALSAGCTNRNFGRSEKDHAASGAATPRDSDAHKRIAVPQALCVLQECLRPRPKSGKVCRSDTRPGDVRERAERSEGSDSTPVRKAPVSACKPLCAILLAKVSVYPLLLVKANMGRLCEKLKNALKSGLEQRCNSNFLAIFVEVILWFFDRLRKAPALLAPEPSLSLTSQVQRKF